MNQLAKTIYETSLHSSKSNISFLSPLEQAALKALQGLFKHSPDELASLLSGEPAPVDWAVEAPDPGLL